MVITWEDALAEQANRGRAEGRAEGRTEGRTEGRLAATHEAILLLARKRRDLPDDFESSILAIEDFDRLHEILDRILEVRSVDELGL